MALPTILVNSATGSDSAASGAGPSTALTGSAAVTDAGGTVVTLDGSPDLTDVATDGSHVLYFADTTAGSRNFGKITAKANSGTPTAQVTVANAFDALDTKAWAIGGKRASIGSTTSKKLFDNNGAAGDAMPGWIVEMESGHTETITATYNLRRAGDATDGPIVLRGTSGAATIPIVNFSNNGTAFVYNAGIINLHDFQMKNSNATKTASVALTCGTASGFLVKGMKIADATNNFWKGISYTGAGSFNVIDSEIGNTADLGFTATGTNSSFSITNCWLHDCGNNGIFANGTAIILTVVDCLITDITGDGIRFGSVGSTVARSSLIMGNTIDGSSSDGIEFTGTTTDTTMNGTKIINNCITNNGGWGINFSGASMSNAAVNSMGFQIRNNAHNGNTSGWISSSITIDEDTIAADPSYTNAGGNDYSVGTSVKAKGFPLAGTLKVGKNSSTDSYVDIGAAQRQEVSTIDISNAQIIAPFESVGY